MIGGAVSAVMSGFLGASKAKRRPIYADYIQAAEQALKVSPKVESYDRSARKDFWNDPDRWEGIEDTHRTMIWEVRRRDVIDVRPVTTPLQNIDPYRHSQFLERFGLRNSEPYRMVCLETG